MTKIEENAIIAAKILMGKVFEVIINIIIIIILFATILGAWLCFKTADFGRFFLSSFEEIPLRGFSYCPGQMPDFGT